MDMEGFGDHHQSTCPQSQQHPDHVSDSAEDPISDEDVLAPTRLSLSSATSKRRENDNRMADHARSAVWDEVLEEADELAHVHKDLRSVSFLSGGTSKRNKFDNKPRFSIRGSGFVASNVKSGNLDDGEQEVSSGMPPAKALETMMAEQVENIDEEIEDLPSDFAHPTKNENISVAELLEDLQDRSGSSVRTPFPFHQHSRATEGKPKVPTSGNKTLALLGQSNLGKEEASQHVIGETSSEDEVEDTVQHNLAMVTKYVKRKTMTDLFQEAFSATDMDVTALPMRSTGAGYYGRMQQILQMEKDRHVEFSRQCSKAPDYLGNSKGLIVQILSRSLEGKLTVCLCLLKEKSNLPITSKVSTDCSMDDSSSKRTIIFSPKICDNEDLVAGNLIHIYPPWKEVKVKEEEVIICTYFSHHVA
ncbi:uncharacterized protein LOC124688154 [Lolium rigidum]|uniref:uncharacterized protein LOC124688154 n=1 Tax=Lolium rigidum TaxID=89674 RepID=UPI001F5CFC4E|nr:uncharacterized protein LOC124688154 [Lolium rigidum]XP_047077825.1 uncharacterized protein LOC124688154 [Lolium rigidum]